MICAKCGQEYKETIFSDCPDFNCPSCKTEKPRETFNIDKFTPDSAIKGILDKIARQGGNEIRGLSDIIKTDTEIAKGIKHDSEKLEWSLLPLAEVEDVIKVLMHGSKKYAPNNWKYVKPKERYIDAAFRHLAARAKGEILDPESGLSHLAHCVCCLLFLSWHDKEDGTK